MNTDPNYQKLNTCTCCGKRETMIWNVEVNAKLKLMRLCFRCNFWDEYTKLEPERAKQQTIVDGRHYMACGPTAGFFKGFGGSKFRIRYNDERGEVVCNNLWAQGDIPEVFRDRLKDNAVFVMNRELLTNN